MNTYELTIIATDGDCYYRQQFCTDFHAACVEGLDYALAHRSRLYSVVRIPTAEELDYAEQMRKRDSAT